MFISMMMDAGTRLDKHGHTVLHALSVPQQIDFLHAGGLCNALAISTILTITVLIPFPLPSTWKFRDIKMK